MQLYYILIAFTLINVVFAYRHLSAIYRDEYKKQVFLTGCLIHRVFYEKKLHLAIKEIICGTEQGAYKYSMVDLAFMTANLPESLDGFTEPLMQQHIKYQTDMQNEIFNATNFAASKPPPNYNFGNRLVPELSGIRSFETLQATINLILNNIILPGPDFSEARFSDVCRLVGLFKSTLNPDLHVISAEVDDLNTQCTLTAVDNSVIRYRLIDGHVYQADGDSVKTLSSEILVLKFIRVEFQV